MTKTYTVNKDQAKTITLKESGDYTITLKGEGADATIKGGFWLKGKDQLELNITIIHAAKNTTANTIIKAIADDTSRCDINGTIIVHKGAQLTNSFLTEKVLLLSPKAQAHAIPNLEIEADDVKCSHAATVGTVDPEQVFYLRSRGISQKQAIKLIAQGFLA